MFRIIDLHLKHWVSDEYRKPLMLRGARQVGKTFAVRKLGCLFSNLVEINFEEIPKLREIFAETQDLNPQRIIRDLGLAIGTTIIPGKTLLFLDEVQIVPRAIIALRYFYEKMPDLHVIAAGSLIEFAIEKVGVPVGRVQFLQMYPMSWVEFLIALKQRTSFHGILNHDPETDISDVVHAKFLELLKEYLAIGGMPEAVAAWVKTNDPEVCSRIHQSILQSYRQDFSRYAKDHQIKYLEIIFESSVRLLGMKFKFSGLPGDYRKRELAPALDLLEKAGVLNRVAHSSGQGIPLGAESNPDQFKVIFLDIGLSQSLLGLQVSDWFLNTNLSFINKGSIIEAFVGQELLAYSNPHMDSKIYYWQRETKGSQAELDYLIQLNNKIIPIEVKSAKGNSVRSMRSFLNSHPNSPYGIRFSTHNYSTYDSIHSYPLYATFSAIQWRPPSSIED